MKSDLYKNNKGDVISWVDNPDEIGILEFTFDGKKFYNLFRDYPEKLTPEQRRIFKKENPYWAVFFGEA